MILDRHSLQRNHLSTFRLLFMGNTSFTTLNIGIKIIQHEVDWLVILLFVLLNTNIIDRNPFDISIYISSHPQVYPVIIVVKRLCILIFCWFLLLLKFFKFYLCFGPTLILFDWTFPWQLVKAEVGWVNFKTLIGGTRWSFFWSSNDFANGRLDNLLPADNISDTLLLEPWRLECGISLDLKNTLTLFF